MSCSAYFAFLPATRIENVCESNCARPTMVHRCTLRQRIAQLPLSVLRDAASNSEDLREKIEEMYPTNIKCDCPECLEHEGRCVNSLFDGTAGRWPNVCSTCDKVFCRTCAIYCGFCDLPICNLCDFCQHCDAACCTLCVPLEVCKLCQHSFCPSLMIYCGSCQECACDDCLSSQPTWLLDGVDRESVDTTGFDHNRCHECRR